MSEIYFVTRLVLTLGNLPTLASRVLGLQTGATICPIPFQDTLLKEECRIEAIVQNLQYNPAYMKQNEIFVFACPKEIFNCGKLPLENRDVVFLILFPSFLLNYTLMSINF